MIRELECVILTLIPCRKDAGKQDLNCEARLHFAKLFIHFSAFHFYSPLLV